VRPDSPSFGRTAAVRLSADRPIALYVPELCAHGFQTLEDDSEVSYAISVPYSPDHATGLRYDDPAFGIEWPLPVSVIAERDRSWPEFQIAQEAPGPARL
jgi:dTDP-4-dehydrorhamnose 3,5-epimerase